MQGMHLNYNIGYDTWQYLYLHDQNNCFYQPRFYFQNRQTAEQKNSNLSPTSQSTELGSAQSFPIGPIEKQNEIEIVPCVKSELSNKSRIEIDEEYNPSYDCKRRSRNQIQNEKRNVMPNLIHQILNFLIRQNKSGALVKKLLKTLGSTQTSVKRYYSFQKLIKKRINRYVNLKTLIKMLNSIQFKQNDVFGRHEQQIYCSIGRRVAVYFLKDISKQVTIHSPKIKPQNRLYHFEGQRTILQSFREEKQSFQH